MSSLNATIWFRDTLDSDQLALGFGKASERLRMEVTVCCGRVTDSNSSEVWSKAISSFADHEFSGSARWDFHGEMGHIRGSITWPIVNVDNIPGTIEFRVHWRDKRKSKSFVFTDLDALVGFLHDLAFAVKATSLCVEPFRLPADMIEERYRRFKRMHSQYTLTSIDWICGVQSSDEQSHIFSRMQEPCESTVDNNRFNIFVFTPEPFDYRSDDDRRKVKELEKEFCLT